MALLLNQLPVTDQFNQLGTAFYSQVSPQGISNPHWVHVNKNALQLLGLDEDLFTHQENLEIFSGHRPLHNTPALAMVYAGHQFGGYSAQLGDGRGLLIAQANTPSGVIDIHIKGAGKTPYSRFGDGRAVLRSSIREYLASEAMHGLGIPTTRALCIVGSDEPVMRETQETAAIVTRLAKTHIRFGHFEYFYYQQRHDELKQLADHVIEQMIPHHRDNTLSPYVQLLEFVVRKSAEMIAHWQAVGFAHGVMNTDNMSIAGETFDYGPYGFLDDYEPGFICNHSDYHGRYAFDQQPSIGLWNLNALAHSLSPLIDQDSIKNTLAHYEPHLIASYSGLMRQKLGLTTPQDGDQTLCASLLTLMAKDSVDYTQCFRLLADVNSEQVPTQFAQLFKQPLPLRQWCDRYNKRLQQEASGNDDRKERMNKVNPKYILRNYYLQRAIDAAQNTQDFSEVDRLFHLVQTPFDEHPHMSDYSQPPPPSGKHLPISCSS